MFFKEQIKKRIKNEKGLTLIELLAVIVILAIIAAIAIPAIGNIINKSRDKAEISDALNVIAGAKLAHIEGGCGSTTDGCKGDTLRKHVDGITLEDSVVVKLNSTTNEWSITGYEIEIKTDEFDEVKDAVGTDNKGVVSEKVLKTAIDQGN